MAKPYSTLEPYSGQQVGNAYRRLGYLDNHFLQLGDIGLRESIEALPTSEQIRWRIALERSPADWNNTFDGENVVLGPRIRGWINYRPYVWPGIVALWTFNERSIGSGLGSAPVIK